MSRGLPQVTGCSAHWGAGWCKRGSVLIHWRPEIHCVIYTVMRVMGYAVWLLMTLITVITYIILEKAMLATTKLLRLECNMHQSCYVSTKSYYCHLVDAGGKYCGNTGFEPLRLPILELVFWSLVYLDSMIQLSMLTNNMGNLVHKTGHTCNIIYYPRYNLSCTMLLYCRLKPV